MDKIAILIPTLGGQTLPIALSSLYLQSDRDFDIYILEKANFPMQNDMFKIFIKLFELDININIFYKYDIKHSSIAMARYILFNTIKNSSIKYKYVMTMDDDILLDSDFLKNFRKNANSIKNCFTFVQGNKVELNDVRNVTDDLTLNISDKDEVTIGDGSLTIYNSEAIPYINWDIILETTDYSKVGGEDIMMSITASKYGKLSYFLKDCIGYHLCLRDSTWSWFKMSDVNIFNTLKRNGYDETKLRNSLNLKKPI